MEIERKHSAYAFGKLSLACTELAIGEGDIKERLISASDHFWAVSPEMLPPEIQEDFVWLKKELTKFPAIRGEGDIIATIKKRHRKTLVRIAERIVFIEAYLRAHLEEKQGSCSCSQSPPAIVFDSSTKDK